MKNLSKSTIEIIINSDPELFKELCNEHNLQLVNSKDTLSEVTTEEAQQIANGMSETRQALTRNQQLLCNLAYRNGYKVIPIYGNTEER